MARGAWFRSFMSFEDACPDQIYRIGTHPPTHPPTQSQVLLAQRVQHIKRLRKARREEIVETEWYSPKQPNRDWRNAFAAAQPGEEAGAPPADAEAKKTGGLPVVDEISEMIEFKAERWVRVYAALEVQCCWRGGYSTSIPLICLLNKTKTGEAAARS